MKKLIPILFAVVALAACQKEPNLSELGDDYVVYTDYDKSIRFGDYRTYYLPDSVLLITDSEKASYWTNDNANYILEAFADNMASRGFVQADTKENADLGLQISYISDTRYFVDYPTNNWWWGYPGYWGPGYWGPYWNSWYYPYPTVYSYSVNSFLAELVDLTDKNDASRRLKVVWDAYLAGVSRVNRDLTVQAIDQAFAQSPYLTINRVNPVYHLKKETSDESN